MPQGCVDGASRNFYQMKNKITLGQKLAARFRKLGVKLNGITWAEFSQRIDWLGGGR